MRRLKALGTTWTAPELPDGAEPANSPWEPPTPENQVRARSENPGPEEHDWSLAGTKRDTPNPTTYFLWGCKKCGRRVVTETASREGEHSADMCPPSERELRRASVDENCLQAAVDAVHSL